ncbi:MAG: cation transporter [Planctomycetaceae bacterium]|nr:cation transporter [Planctomycetaceae bacterium]
MDTRHKAMAVSLAISFLMLAGKITAYWVTSSAAVLADAAESVVHVVATAFAAFSLWYASRPADANHPFGHGRISFFSAGFEGALILIAAVAVIAGGIQDLIKGPDVKHIGLGLALTASLAIINLALGITLVMIGKRQNSLVVKSNGIHVLTDVYTTAAAIVGLGLIMLTGYENLDPIAAILIGFLIMYNGFGMVRTAIAGLMDELDPTISKRLDQAVENAMRGSVVKDVHELKARRVDDQLWLQFHALVDGDTNILEAHSAITNFEQSLQSEFPDFKVNINSHLEPADHDLEAH